MMQQKENNKWLQENYATILFSQCTSYIENFDSVGKTVFRDKVDMAIERGVFVRPVIFPSLWECDKRYSILWSSVTPFNGDKVKRQVRCSHA